MQTSDPSATDTDENLAADVSERVSSENKARDTLISTALSGSDQDRFNSLTSSYLESRDAPEEDELEELLDSGKSKTLPASEAAS